MAGSATATTTTITASDDSKEMKKSERKAVVGKTLTATKKKSISTKRSSLGGSDKKKRRSRRKESFSLYVYKVLRQVHTDIGISSKAMSVMNSFVNDIFERIAAEASKLGHYNKRATITSREVQRQCDFSCPGNWLSTQVNRIKMLNYFRSTINTNVSVLLFVFSVSEGTKSVTKYNANLNTSQWRWRWLPLIFYILFIWYFQNDRHYMLHNKISLSTFSLLWFTRNWQVSIKMCS